MDEKTQAPLSADETLTPDAIIAMELRIAGSKKAAVLD